MMRAMIATSGGVDSSVAALLMTEAGYDCTGVTMRLYRESGYQTSCEKSCCSDADEEYAALVCWQLGIAHESMCFSKDFEQAVIRRFIREYEAGRTPNPCIDCNRYLKFDALLEQAKKKGYDILATGHYARIAYSEELRRWQLFKAVDEKKDQSYVLYMLTQEQLRCLRFPLGALHKSEARQLAEAHKLVNAEKRDSQDICFIPDGDYAGFIRRRTGKRYPDGDILDQNGNIVAFLFGAHKVKIYRVLHMMICALGALISVQLLWDAADVCNGLMAIPNLFSLILFGSVVVKDTKDFFASYDKAKLEKT